MGNNQLLLILLGVIVIGVAITVALILVNENAVNQNRDAVASDLMTIAVRAQQYYNTPTSMRGGGHTYIGLSADSIGMLKIVSSNFITNGNGSYTIRSAGTTNRLILEGIGNTALSDGSFPVLVCTITPGQALVNIEN